MEGWLALATILLTIAAMIYIALNRHIIWPERFVQERSPRATPRRPHWATPRRPPRRSARSPALAETPTKPAATISEPISAITTPKNDAETIAIMTIAKLIAAGQVGETAALQTVFAVKAGSSRRYKDVQAKLKIAQQELESIEPAAPVEAGQQR